MGRKRRRIEPFETAITHLAKGGVGVGVAPDGRPVHVRFAPPGFSVRVGPRGLRKGTWQGARIGTTHTPEHAIAPSCPVFGLCGGCSLQELPLAIQRGHKHDLAMAQITASMPIEGVAVHPVRGDDEAYAYRNKVELSFGTSRYLSEEDHRAGHAIDGRFIGMHAPGRFDRVVDTDRCALVSERANAVLGAVREVALGDDSPAPRNPRTHEGFWRHLLIREGFATGSLLVALFTTSPTGEAEAAVERTVARIRDAVPEVAGVLWLVNDEVADVARGTLRQTWGEAQLTERLGEVAFELSHRSFFQTSTRGAEILYDTIREAIGPNPAPVLYDLYCGIGSIGLYLQDAFDTVIGIEEVEAAVHDARQNAERNGLTSCTYRAARVEDALDLLPREPGRHVLVVDPPRAGLHPKVARALAQAPGDLLIYVACNPASLGRDGAVLAEGGWTLTDLWTVDLFPQTGHIEVVGRFVRAS